MHAQTNHQAIAFSANFGITIPPSARKHTHNGTNWRQNRCKGVRRKTTKTSQWTTHSTQKSVNIQTACCLPYSISTVAADNSNAARAHTKMKKVRQPHRFFVFHVVQWKWAKCSHGKTLALIDIGQNSMCMTIGKCSVIYRICANLLKRLSSGLPSFVVLSASIHAHKNRTTDDNERKHEIKGENLNTHYG